MISLNAVLRELFWRSLPEADGHSGPRRYRWSVLLLWDVRPATRRAYGT